MLNARSTDGFKIYKLSLGDLLNQMVIFIVNLI
jgi:hypothetical protein